MEGLGLGCKPWTGLRPGRAARAQVEAEGRASAHGRERAELAAALARAEAGLADERRQVWLI
jgi:hypothetical protein